MEAKMMMRIAGVAIERGGVAFDVHRVVDKDDPRSKQEKIGTIDVSNGSMLWCSKNVSKKNQYKVSWEDFDKIIKRKDVILKMINDGTIK